MDVQTNRENVIKLLTFLKGMNSIKKTVVTDVKKQPWFTNLSDLPQDTQYIKIKFHDEPADSDDSSENDYLVKIQKPIFEKCPSPKDSFKDWLKAGWDDYAKEPEYLQEIKREADTVNESSMYEEFEDDEQRVEDYQNWLKDRKIWQERQKALEKVNRHFLTFFSLYQDLEQDSETNELVVANGLLMIKDQPEINHPILLQKVKIEFDDRENVLSVVDGDSNSQLYDLLFSKINNVSSEAFQTLQKKLNESLIHPLDRREATSFFEIAAHRLSSRGEFLKEDDEILNNSQDELFIKFKPMLILRKKLDGLPKFIDKSIADIKDGGNIPNTLLELAGEQGPRPLKPDQDLSVEQELAEVGGEDPTILLAKPANREQLQIAREIQTADQVLVQGPPGTGKTHTIANLIGNFLAQGQSVLVSSSTSKALSVLKDKLPKELQSLCVSVFDDSKKDMERSIAGITEHMANDSAESLRNKAKRQAKIRDGIIADLSATRKKIYEIKYSEYSSLIFNGKSMSPTKAATYVSENAERLDYIPGKIKPDVPLPLSYEELSNLYKSNASVSAEEERELAEKVPNPEMTASPMKLSELLTDIDNLRSKISNIAVDQQIEYDEIGRELVFKGKHIPLQDDPKKTEALKQLRDYLGDQKIQAKWELSAIVDGKDSENNGARNRWKMLCDQIEKSAEISNRLTSELFGKEIQIQSNDSIDLRAVISKMKDKYQEKGKIGKLARILNKEFDIADSMVKINGKTMKSAEDCTLVLGYLQMQEARNTCRNYWQDLIHEPEFDSLNNGRQPELQALKYVNQIKNRVNWYEKYYGRLKNLVQLAGFDSTSMFSFSYELSDLDITSAIFDKINRDLPLLCQIELLHLELQQRIRDYHGIKDDLQKAGTSEICRKLMRDCENKDIVKYSEDYQELQRLYGLYSVQKLRKDYLAKLSEDAPVWAEKIRNREEEFGKDSVPEYIEEAWQWKQYSQKLDEITSAPFEKLQKKNTELSREYRRITAELAETKAWQHLLEKAERNPELQKSLQSWKLTTQKIGKGKGKNAPLLRAQAQELMVKCQNAVPVWIMTLSNVTNNMVPGKNMFDVLIIDEASQADLSALSVLYLAKKVIIVGDDKQVSPTGSFVNLDDLNSLAASTIKDVISNWSLFSASTSLYDIASTVCRPLMLREHFRCVPDIIGFSNRLSYDGKIKPLRDSSSSDLRPAVINYRVAGHRAEYRKVNEVEADTIVALIQAMLETKQYSDKTIGVISLNGEEQAKLIQKKLVSKLNLTVYQKHKLLCGSSAQFQGDERDVMLLSMVDSNDDHNGPLRKRGLADNQPGKDLRKRYNVAVSRAKDQLWVVNSLDYANDLQEGDVRKELLEYADNPQAYAIDLEQIKAKAESPFEEEVAKALSARGYNLIQQWPVGAYRIDMVAVDGNHKAAIECDGERWHSSEEQIRNDMERQTILERIGWHFIRIRGSEYYRNAEATIDRVCTRLDELGVGTNHQEYEPQDGTELLKEVKRKAARFLTTDSVEQADPEELLSWQPTDATENENDGNETGDKFSDQNVDATDWVGQNKNIIAQDEFEETGISDNSVIGKNTENSLVEVESNAINLEKLVLEFNKLEPGYYDLLVLFQHDPALMADLGIDTEQELLELCKKLHLADKLQHDLTFITGTKFEIGSQDEREWLKKQLSDFIGMKCLAASNNISAKSGFSPQTINNQINRLLPNWVNEKGIIVDPSDQSLTKDQEKRKQSAITDLISIFKKLSPGLYDMQYVFGELSNYQREDLGVDSSEELLEFCKSQHIERSVPKLLSYEREQHFRIGEVSDRDWLIKFFKRYSGEHKYAVSAKIAFQSGLSVPEIESLMSSETSDWISKQGIVTEPESSKFKESSGTEFEGIKFAESPSSHVLGLAEESVQTDAAKTVTKEAWHEIPRKMHASFDDVFEFFARNSMQHARKIDVGLLNEYNKYCQSLGLLDAKENSLAEFRNKVIYSRKWIIQSENDSYRFYSLSCADDCKEELISAFEKMSDGKHPIKDFISRNSMLVDRLAIDNETELVSICEKLHLANRVDFSLEFYSEPYPLFIKGNHSEKIADKVAGIALEQPAKGRIATPEEIAQSVRKYAVEHLHHTLISRELFEEYQQFCRENLLAGCQDLISFQDALIKDRQIVISKDDRYSFIDPEKVSSQRINQLLNAFKWYRPGIVSVKLIFEELPMLMEQLGLSDEYELYTFCEKQGIAMRYKAEVSLRLTFIEEPCVLFGYVKKEDWFGDILKYRTGDVLDHVLSSISIETGVSENFLYNQVMKNYSEYIKDGIIQEM